MIRVRFIKNYKDFKKGDIETLSPNEAFGVIDAGFAVVSKEMTTVDYQEAQDEVKQTKVITKKEFKTK